MREILAALLSLALAVPATAEPRRFAVTVDNFMRGPELYGYTPRAVRWSGDGKRVIFQWKRHTDAFDKDYDTYAVNRDGGGLRKLSEDEARAAAPVSGHESPDKSRLVFADRGDVWLYDRATDSRRQLTKTQDAESNPRFTRDGKRVAFMRGGNLFLLALDGGFIEQLTDIRSGPAAAERKGTDSQEQLKKEERALLDVVARRARKREEDEARRKKDDPRKPFHLAARQSAAALSLAPDESYILATITEQGEGAKNTIVPNFVTESSYTEDINSRSKVGDAQNRQRLALIRTTSGEVVWVDFGLGERAVRPSFSQWSEDGKLALLVRAADNKDRWLMALDPATGKTRTLATDHDDAWVDGPGSRTLGWLGDNQTLYFQSERSGWAHLYTVPFAGGEPRALTSGTWEVQEVELSRDKRTFFLTTNESSHAERQIYTMPAAGGPRTRITMGAGFHDAAFAPDGKAMAVVYSYTNRPPELYLMDVRPGAPMLRVTDSPAPEFKQYAWVDPPIVQIPARDGAQIPARVYKPKSWKPGGALVFFVHGAGYLQNAHRGWSTYDRPYLFHHILLELGYLVLDIDYRGSAGYGRDWRTGIYRFMGGKDLDDHVDAARWAVKEYGADPKRIGMYGGSYGGFMTLMAMFTAADTFAAGAALRPVTDWAHYNHGYTSDILNIPQKDLEAYKRSSPIHHAAGLKGALLICHGMVDTNVHFQDTVRLVQKLIELRKENWEMAVYPVEDHSFVQPSSWADEYKRILKLFETVLKR